MERRAIASFMKYALEPAYVQMARERGQNPMACLVEIGYKYSIEAWTEHSNWQTKDGKAFCSQLRQALGLSADSLKKGEDGKWIVVSKDSSPNPQKPFFCFSGFPDAACRKHKVLHRGGWSAYEPSANTLNEKLFSDNQGDAKAGDGKDAKNGDGDVKMDDRPTCVICQDRPADTLVLPCEPTACSLRAHCVGRSLISFF